MFSLELKHQSYKQTAPDPLVRAGTSVKWKITKFDVTSKTACWVKEQFFSLNLEAKTKCFETVKFSVLISACLSHQLRRWMRMKVATTSLLVSCQNEHFLSFPRHFCAAWKPFYGHSHCKQQWFVALPALYKKQTEYSQRTDVFFKDQSPWNGNHAVKRTQQQCWWEYFLVFTFSMM